MPSVTEVQLLGTDTRNHSWAQRKLSPLSPFSPLNILLSINGPLISLGFNGLTINGCNLQTFNDQRFQQIKIFLAKPSLELGNVCVCGRRLQVRSVGRTG